MCGRVSICVAPIMLTSQMLWYVVLSTMSGTTDRSPAGMSMPAAVTAASRVLSCEVLFSATATEAAALDLAPEVKVRRDV